MNEEHRPGLVPLVLVGLVTGLLSGLFGIGGGTFIVPALALWLHMPQRLATGTSVAAILPSAVVGAISYGVQGNVDWGAALSLAIGLVAGAQVGSYLLSRAKVAALRWGFMVFQLAVIISLWFVVPQRDDVISLSVVTVILLVVAGFGTGILGGLLGLGGGVILVPSRRFCFGASDLVAKGSSLVMMIPGSVSGTIGNLRRKNVDLRAALAVGIAGSACVPFGSIIAGLVEPFVGNVLFSACLMFIVVQMLVRTLKDR
jgi:uncharacterized membrane protein YfcA